VSYFLIPIVPILQSSNIKIVGLCLFLPSRLALTLSLSLFSVTFYFSRSPYMFPFLFLSLPLTLPCPLPFSSSISLFLCLLSFCTIINDLNDLKNSIHCFTIFYRVPQTSSLAHKLFSKFHSPRFHSKNFSLVSQNNLVSWRLMFLLNPLVRVSTYRSKIFFK
jgi:hypothetical protein